MPTEPSGGGGSAARSTAAAVSCSLTLHMTPARRALGIGVAHKRPGNGLSLRHGGHVGFFEEFLRLGPVCPPAVLSEAAIIDTQITMIGRDRISTRGAKSAARKGANRSSLRAVDRGPVVHRHPAAVLSLVGCCYAPNVSSIRRPDPLLSERGHKHLPALLPSGALARE